MRPGRPSEKQSFEQRAVEKLLELESPRSRANGRLAISCRGLAAQARGRIAERNAADEIEHVTPFRSDVLERDASKTRLLRLQHYLRLGKQLIGRGLGEIARDDKRHRHEIFPHENIGAGAAGEKLALERIRVGAALVDAPERGGDRWSSRGARRTAKAVVTREPLAIILDRSAWLLRDRYRNGVKKQHRGEQPSSFDLAVHVHGQPS
jgi:hypothetical protein